MRVSQITISDICRQLRIEEEYLENGEAVYIEEVKRAAVEYAKSYTGLSEEDLDTHEDITIAVLVLISDLYDNRQMYVDKGNINRVVDTILGMHCENLL